MVYSTKRHSVAANKFSATFVRIMHRFIRTFLLLSTTCLLGACSNAVVQPELNFIGIGSGTLVSDVNTIQYTQTFDPSARSLIAVVSFAKIMDGSTVQATWFSPDDRSMPLGRTSIVTKSGATLARFSFVSKENWQPAPYQLRIDVQSGEDPTTMKTASGSLAFFIGMKENEIKAYLSDLAAWKREDERKRAILTDQQKKEQDITDSAQKLFGSAGAMIALRTDFIGSKQDQYFIVGQNEEDLDAPPMGGGGPGVLYSGVPQGFAITDQSGSLILAMGETVKKNRIIRDNKTTLSSILPKSGDLQVVVLPSHTIAITWQNTDKKSCTIELRPDGDTFVVGEEQCS